MDGADVAEQGYVPLVIEQPRLHARKAPGEPFPVRERHELVIPPVQEQHGDGDVAELEAPGPGVGFPEDGTGDDRRVEQLLMWPSYTAGGLARCASGYRGHQTHIRQDNNQKKSLLAFTK